MKSIRTKLVAYFIIVIVITVIVLEILLVNIIKQNYYKNLETSLLSHIKISADIYLRYFSDTTLYENILNNVDTFWKQTTAQVEIVDTSGKVLMDSIGVLPEQKTVRPDIEEALQGNAGKWVGKVDYTDQEVMAVSYPLRSGDKIVGALRFVSSLENINNEITRITQIFIVIGVLVILIGSFASVLLANTIVRPIKAVTLTATRMASGNFNVKCDQNRSDEIGKLSSVLNFMASEITMKEQLKNEFISSVSHELRTPLTSIKGWAVTLKSGSLDDKKLLSDGLEIIEKESDRLTLMVEELLDFSKFISGKVTLKKTKVNIPEIMKHIKTQLSPRAERDGIGFIVICPENLPDILVDENRMKQIFINVLDNAFKFTPVQGTVSFSAKSEYKNIVFSIKDSGCGISPEELPRVKEKFYKGKNSKSQNGIGLSICDELIKLMGGSFEIKSEIDKGTEVYITLPLEEDTVAQKS